MLLFDGSDGAELDSKLWETFFHSLFSHGVVHVGPLVILSVSRIFKVRYSVRNTGIVQKFEPQFGVHALVNGCFFEEGSNLLVAVFACLTSIIVVFHACLTLSCKCSFKVCFGLCSFNCLGIECLELVSLCVANRAFSRCFCSFVHVSAYSTNKCFLHNVLFLFVIRIFLVGNVVVPEHACRFLFNRKKMQFASLLPCLRVFLLY